MRSLQSLLISIALSLCLLHHVLISSYYSAFADALSGFDAVKPKSKTSSSSRRSKSSSSKGSSSKGGGGGRKSGGVAEDEDGGKGDLICREARCGASTTTCCQTRLRYPHTSDRSDSSDSSTSSTGTSTTTAATASGATTTGGIPLEGSGREVCLPSVVIAGVQKSATTLLAGEIDDDYYYLITTHIYHIYAYFDYVYTYVQH